MLKSLLSKFKPYNLYLIESAAEPVTAELVEAPAPLVERALRDDGTGTMRIIEPGWGSSGYYSREVLERDGPAAFPVGTFQFWNHPTESEDQDRPEGDLNALAAVTLTPAEFIEDGPEGPGLYAEFSTVPRFIPTLDDIGEHIGVSIFAAGTAVDGEVEGRRGPIIQSLISREENPRNSIDFVTLPGAGGRIVSIFEAAANNEPLPEPIDLEEKRNTGEFVESRLHLALTQIGDDLYGDGRINREERIAMSNAVGAALDAFRETLLQNAPGLYRRDLYQAGDDSADLADEADAPLAESEERMSQEQLETIERLQRQLATERAERIIAERLDKAELPEKTSTRIRASLLGQVQMTEAGDLDAVAFETAVESAIEQAHEEIEAIAGTTAKIKGEGSDGDDVGDDLPTVQESQASIDDALSRLITTAA